MKTSLLFSSFPFIASEKVTLTRMTELDLNAMWEIMGDEENYRFAPTAALRTPTECGLKLRQIEAMFKDRVAITLGIYPNGRENRLAGFLEIYGIDPRIQAVTVRFTLHRDCTGMGPRWTIYSALLVCTGYRRMYCLLTTGASWCWSAAAF